MESSTSSFILRSRYFFRRFYKPVTCSCVSTLPNFFKNSYRFGKLAGSMKLSSVHNSSVLFWSGVPVSRANLFNGRLLSRLSILAFLFFNRCASSIIVNYQGIVLNTLSKSYMNTSKDVIRILNFISFDFFDSRPRFNISV